MKDLFPFFNKKENTTPVVYLDSAGTTQVFQSVLDRIQKSEIEGRANPHSGIHATAVRAQQEVSQSRRAVATFIGAKQDTSIIFTKSTTESINLVAYGWALQHLKKGDTIAISEMEHHANMLPWNMVAEKTGATIKWIKLTEEGAIDTEHAQSVIDNTTKLVALTHVSNVLGVINPIQNIITHAHACGAKVLVDGAQAVGHISVYVTECDADWYAFSAHKMYGSMGVGVLYAKKDVLPEMFPMILGGGAVASVTKEKTNWLQAPEVFEAGTLNVSGIVGLHEAIAQIQQIGFDTIVKHEQELTAYAIERLKDITGITLYGSKDIDNRIGIISFSIEGVHPHDVASLLDEHGIAIRAGHHCCGVLMETLGVPATCRVSFGIYSTFEDIDRLIEGIALIQKKFN